MLNLRGRETNAENLRSPRARFSKTQRSSKCEADRDSLTPVEEDNGEMEYAETAGGNQKPAT